MTYESGRVCVIGFAAISLLAVAVGSGKAARQRMKGRTSREQSRFNLEERVKKPIQVPSSALQVLKKDSSVTTSGCDTDQFSEAWFEAAELHLDGPLDSELLVKAKDGCLFGANIGPFWIFKATPQGYQLILSVSALGLEVLPLTSNGYRDIRVGAVAGGRPAYVTFKFDGQRYQEGPAEDTPKKNRLLQR